MTSPIAKSLIPSNSSARGQYSMAKPTNIPGYTPAWMGGPPVRSEINRVSSRGVGLGSDIRQFLRDPQPINSTPGFVSNGRVNITRNVRIWDKNISCVPTHGHVVFISRVPVNSTGTGAIMAKSVESRISDSVYRAPVLGFETSPPVDAFVLTQLNYVLASTDVRRANIVADNLWFNGFEGNGKGWALDGVTVSEDGSTDRSGSTHNRTQNRQLEVTIRGSAHCHNIFGRASDMIPTLKVWMILKRIRMGATNYIVDPYNESVGHVRLTADQEFRPFQMIPYCSRSFEEPPDQLLEYEDYPEEQGMEREWLRAKKIYVGRIREVPEADQFLRRNVVKDNALYSVDLLTSYTYHLGLPKIVVDFDIDETI